MCVCGLSIAKKNLSSWRQFELTGVNIDSCNRVCNCSLSLFLSQEDSFHSTWRRKRRKSALEMVGKSIDVYPHLLRLFVFPLSLFFVSIYMDRREVEKFVGRGGNRKNSTVSAHVFDLSPWLLSNV